MTRKVYSVLIICLASVTSLWVLEKGLPGGKGTLIQNADAVSAISVQNEAAKEASDWKSLISTTGTGGSDGQSGDTTITAQLAKDLLSRYLSIAPQGSNLTDEDLSRVASDTLSTSDYTSSQGAVYVASNLHILNQNDKNVLQTYHDNLISIFQKRTPKVEKEPMKIIADALQKTSPEKLSELDPIIGNTRGAISDLLNIPVPSEAVAVHLAVLNATSNLLTDVLGMREAYSDPARTFAAIGGYQKHIDDTQTALSNLKSFFDSKLK